MVKKRVADVLVDTLVAAGVKRVYGLVGDSLNGVTDSIRPRKDLQWIPVRHEETAAFAAGAEAHLTGQLTVFAGRASPQRRCGSRSESWAGSLFSRSRASQADHRARGWAAASQDCFLEREKDS
jgi:Thiamine pyrophosphate enzyme, N-terminal TPP binding domain